MAVRNVGLKTQRLGGGLQSVLCPAHPAQHYSQSRIGSRLIRIEGYGPLHLRHGSLILLLVKRDKAQDHMVKVVGVTEGQGPVYRRHRRLQRLASGALLPDPLPQVALSQEKMGTQKIGTPADKFLQ